MMRLKLNRILPLLVAAALAALAGCARHSAEWQRLGAADAVMEELPDSALAILSAIDPASLATPEENARYALLMTQAQVKNGYLIKEDSIIGIALDYYSNKESSPELMKALFYSSEIKYNQGDYSGAMGNLMKSLEIANNKGDFYWLAKNEELIADVFAQTYNLNEWAEYSFKASEHYASAQKALNSLYTKVDFANAVGSLGECDRSIALLDSISRAACSNYNDSALMAYALKAEFQILVNSEKNQEGLKCLEKIRELNRFYPYSSKSLAKIALLYIRMDHADKSAPYIKAASSLVRTSSDEASVLMAEASYLKNQGEYAQAMDCVDSAMTIQNEEVKKILQQSVFASQRDYYDARGLEEKLHSSELRHGMLLVLALAVGLMIAIYIWHRGRIKTKEIEINLKVQDLLIATEALKHMKSENLIMSESLRESQLKQQEINSQINIMSESLRESQLRQKETDLQINSLTESIKENQLRQREIDTQINGLVKELESLFTDSWSVLNMLCNQFFMDQRKEKSSEQILKSIKDELKKVKGPKKINEIERSVNKYRDGVVTKMREECAFIKEKDFPLLILTLAGFAPRAVCVFTDMKLGYYYVKRTRLIDRISSSHVPHKDLFLELLSGKKSHPNG